MTTPAHTLRHLTPTDLPALLALIESVGWEAVPKKNQRYLEWVADGAYGLFTGERLIATGGAFCYADQLAWFANVIVHPDQQGQGLGRQITTTLIDHVRERSVKHIMLDASPFGRPLYERMGFRPLYPVVPWQLASVPAISADPAVRPLEPADLPAVIALDEELIGAPRPTILRGFAADHPATCWVDSDQGELQGFLLAKNWRADQTVHIGPLEHRTPAGAERLLHTALNAMQGYTVSMTVPAPNTHAHTLIERCNFKQALGNTRMILGESEPPMPTPVDGYYATAGFAMG